jgi:hypothetical protein
MPCPGGCKGGNHSSHPETGNPWLRFLKESRVCDSKALELDIGFFSQLLWEMPFFNLIREGAMRSQLPSRQDVPKHGLGLQLRTWGRWSESSLLLLSKFIFFHFFKNSKFWLFFVSSGPLGRQKAWWFQSRHRPRNRVALSVLSPDKWYLYTHPNLKRKCISLGFKHCNRYKAKIKTCCKVLNCLLSFRVTLDEII